LQFFCELRLVVLTLWADQVIDVYVPVIEHMEDAMIAEQKALLEKGWSTNPKSYTDCAFPWRQQLQAQCTTWRSAKLKPQASCP
jgi:hypothetical protein